MIPTRSRRGFLEDLGKSGAALAAGSWLGSIGYAAATGPARAVVNQARYRSELDRRLLGAFLEHLGRAIYTGRLRAGLTAGRQERISHRRNRANQGARRAHHAVSGRQFRVRVQLARWCRPQGQAADGAGARLEFARDEPVRDQRFHRLVQAGGHRAAAGHELRHRHRGDGGRLRRVLQRRQGHQVERSAAVARVRTAAQRTLLVPGQRDGWSVADRPHAGARIRPESARHGPADARHRSRAEADRLRLQQPNHAHLSRVGSRGARRVL